MNCKHNDCGWCYAPEGKITNSFNGACKGSSNCAEFAGIEIAQKKETKVKTYLQYKLQPAFEQWFTNKVTGGECSCSRLEKDYNGEYKYLKTHILFMAFVAGAARHE